MVLKLAKGFNYSKLKEYKLYNIMKAVAIPVCKVRVKYQFEGLENVPEKGGFIMAANHISIFDPVLIGIALKKRPIHYMGKEELFENPLLGKFLTHMDAFPIKRGTGDMSSIEYAEKIVKNGWILGVFPEGTRSKDFKPQRPKSGIALIAKQTKADVLPVSIYTADDYKRGTTVTIRFGKLIKNEEFGFTENVKSKELRSAATKVMDEIVKLWEEGHCKK
ncbi:MAG: lysophospholipid acyltransferase family protein [Oscillospiraceae bacterium]